MSPEGNRTVSRNLPGITRENSKQKRPSRDSQRTSG
jgi:hypothetical protein